MRGALLLAQEEDWEPAVELDESPRAGAWVTELTDLCDLSSWGPGTRLICRRERPHPGAELSLFDTAEGFRHTCVITSTAGTDIAALELRHRGHSRTGCGTGSPAAFRISLSKTSCAMRAPWLQVSLVAGALIAWSQMLCFDGALAKAEPKTFHYRVLHVAALLVRRGRHLILRIDETWPWSSDLERGFTRIRTAVGSLIPGDGHSGRRIGHQTARFGVGRMIWISVLAAH